MTLQGGQEQQTSDKQSLTSTSSIGGRRQRRQRRFLLVGPKAPEKNSRQCFGKRIRFYAFWIAVMQVMLGLGCLILGVSQLVHKYFELSLVIIGAIVLVSLLLIRTGMDGVYCTINRGRVEENGLANERRLERIIVWSWSSGLVVVVLILAALCNVGENWPIMLLLLVPSPLYCCGAFIAWAYKEQTLRATLVMMDDGVEQQPSKKLQVDPEAPLIESSKSVMWPPPDVEKGVSKFAYQTKHFSDSDEKEPLLQNSYNHKDDEDGDSSDSAQNTKNLNSNLYESNGAANATIWPPTTPSQSPTPPVQPPSPRLKGSGGISAALFVPAIKLPMLAKRAKKALQQKEEKIEPFFKDNDVKIQADNYDNFNSKNQPRIQLEKKDTKFVAGGKKNPKEGKGQDQQQNINRNPFDSYPQIQIKQKEYQQHQNPFEMQNLDSDQNFSSDKNGRDLNPFETTQISQNNPFDSDQTHQNNPFDSFQNETYNPFDSGTQKQNSGDLKSFLNLPVDSDQLMYKRQKVQTQKQINPVESDDNLQSNPFDQQQQQQQINSNPFDSAFDEGKNPFLSLD